MKGKQNFVFDKNTDTYTVQLKKKKLWWLLLLLLPFLLLILQIRIHKQIVFKTIDKSSGFVLSDAVVGFTYPSRNFIEFSPINFNTYKDIEEQKITESDGLATFEVSYTLFQKLFGKKDKAGVVATGGCFQSDSLTPVYFDLFKNEINEIELNSRQKNISFYVIDSLDQQPLPDADVTIDYFINGQKQSTTVKSDARGIVDAQILYCADSLSITATRYGYKDYYTNGSATYFESQNNRTLPLAPILTQLEFSVKDLYTKRPVPGAKAKLVIENNVQNATTNTDGIGKGMFDSIAVVKEMYIEVSHPAYYDTITKKYTVEEFIKLSEEQRTIYIRPKPGSYTFKNVDRFTSDPIEGAKNEVFVNGQKVGDFFSNSFGEFTVPNLTAKDKVTVIATHEDYNMNDYTIKDKPMSQLNTDKSREIPMDPDYDPKNVQPPKPNCRAHFSGTLLSDIAINNHISIIYKADEYGEYVGEGEYPSNALAFPNAVSHTFDAIAVDAGTRVILYSKPNFKGTVLLDITGPALINNVKWKDEARIKSVNTKTLSNGLEALFPKSCRKWSSSDMNAWSNGSVKVICNQ